MARRPRSCFSPISPRLRAGHSLRRTPELDPQSALCLKVKRWVVVSYGSGVFLRILGPDTRNPFFKASNISSEVSNRLGTTKAFAGCQRLLNVVETGNVLPLSNKGGGVGTEADHPAGLHAWFARRNVCGWLVPESGSTRRGFDSFTLLKVDRGALIPTRAFEGAVPIPST